MYKSEYTPHEAQELFKLIEESDHHQAYKERFKRYVRVRTVEPVEAVEK
jgi:hypothetical protein